MHHQRAGKADALPHAARQLLWIGRFEAVETDEVDGLQRTLPRFVGGHPQCLEANLNVFEHRQPGEQREALEHHGDAVGRAFELLALVDHLAARRPDQSGDDAQQRRLPAARAAQETDDLALVEYGGHAFEHRRAVIGVAAAAVALGDVADLE